MKRFLPLFLMGLFSLSSPAQTRFADIMNRANAKPERVYQYYLHQQPDSIYEMGRPFLSRYLTLEQFSGQLQGVSDRLGQPVDASLWEKKELQGFEIYSRHLTFPRYTATLSVSFDADGTLVGFSFGNEQSRLAEGEHNLLLRVNDSIELPARLTLPPASAAKGRVPAAILVHGSGPGNMDESLGANAPFRDLAEGLSRRGVAVLRYDKRTLVCPDFFIADGADYTYDDETVDDALRAVQVVRDSLSTLASPAIDPSRVYIIGHSLGGMLAPRIAQRSGAVAGLVMLAAPTGKIRPTMERQLVCLGKTEDEARQTVDGALAMLPDAYLDFDAHYSPTAVARELSVPMLILQGERDYQVTMDDYSVWREAVGRQKGVALKSYPSLNHLFIAGEGASTPEEYQRAGHVAEEVMDDIAHFILSQK